MTTMDSKEMITIFTENLKSWIAYLIKYFKDASIIMLRWQMTKFKN